MSDPTEDIWQALIDRIGVMALDIDLPIAWDGPNFDAAAAGQEYLRVKFVPNVANRQLIGSDDPHQYLGLLQISVYWPLGSFENVPREIAGRVAAYFPCDLKLTEGDVTVRITKRPDVTDLIVEKVAVQVPVTISWEAYA